jgi:hypothetical protein
MFRSVNYCVIILSLLILLFCQAAFSAIPLTKEQAIDIATKFITSVGWPMPDADKLTCKLEDDGRSGRKGDKLWKVMGAKNTFDVKIDAQTSYVCFGNNSIWFATRTQLQPEQIPVKLTAETAKALARAYLTAAGIPTESLKISSNKLDNLFPGNIQCQDWVVLFSQTYHGYVLPFGATVVLDDTDGSLISFGAPLSPLTPEDSTVRLSQTDADNHAHDFFTAVGKQLGSRIQAL